MITEDKKQWIKDSLADSQVVVEFTKLNGDYRKMSCTLAKGYVPEAKKDDPLTQKKVRKLNEEVCVVWDMNAEGWRSFRWDTVIDAISFPLGNGVDAQV